MATFRVELGDLSGDGHGITRSYVVEVPDHFSPAVMEANYQKNISAFGFSPYDFGDTYEAEINPEHKSILVANGFPESNFDSYEGRIFATEGIRSALDVCMFFVGHGLDGFVWKVVPDTIPVLFGYGAGSIDDRNIGYAQLLD